MNTLKLSSTWDLELDAFCSVATLDDTEGRIAQDVASAVRTFRGECWFATDEGIPYFDDILGQSPTSSMVAYEIARRAEEVEGVASASCEITGIAGRSVAGDISLTYDDGTTETVEL